MRENEAYTSISELQESFEMSKNVCYAATEPKRIWLSNYYEGLIKLLSESEKS